MATVDVDILQVDTSKSQQSIAGLRNKIKSLKDQLVNLDEGTKEYNDTLLALGDKTHQLKEIQEQVKQTTTDFGDRLSNVRGTITGAAGAFQTVIGSLSLMGVQMGDDVKMLKMLQSAMSITQGVAAIDSGIKSFKALTISIKASITAAGGLGKALKAIVASNPIGLLLTAATALVGVIASVVSKTKEMEEAATKALKEQMLEYFKQLTTWAEKFKQQLEDAIGVLKGGTSEEMTTFWDKNSQYIKDAKKQLADFRVHLYGLRQDYEKTMEPMAARYAAEQKYLQDNANAIINLQKQIEKEEAKSENADKIKIKRLQAEIEQYTALNNLLLKEQSTWADITAQVYGLNAAIDASNQMTRGTEEDLQAVYEPLLDDFLKLLDVIPGLNAEFTYWRKDGVKSVEDLQSALNQLYTNYNYIQGQFAKRGLLNLMSDQDQDIILQQFANTNAKVAAEQRRAEEQRKQQAAAAARKAAEQRKTDLKRIAEIEREAQIGMMSEEEGALAKLKDKYDEQVKLYQKRGQDIATLTEYYKKQKKEIEEKYEKERMEKAKEATEKTQAERELAADVEYRMQQAAIILENKKTADDELLQLDIDFNCRQQELLHERLEQNLITEQEYADQMATLELEAANLQIEQEKRVTEKTQAELEKRKKIHQNYAKATGTVVDSVCNILGSIGSTLEQGTAEWKAVMTAQAIISTIKGGIDSYMGMIASIPGPAGIIAGVAAAVATVAAGMAEVAKIQSTEVSTTGSSSTSTNSNTALGNVNAGAVSMLSTQITNTRNIATEDDITELPATRVYVLESDITESQNRVRTTVENSTY